MTVPEESSVIREAIPNRALRSISCLLYTSRPIGVYLDLLPAHGVTCRTKGGLPLSIYGTLNSGEFILPGNISSQFITGLLLACPLLPEESTVRLSSPLESAAYVDMTLEAMQAFGIQAVSYTHLDGYKRQPKERRQNKPTFFHRMIPLRLTFIEQQ